MAKRDRQLWLVAGEGPRGHGSVVDVAVNSRSMELQPFAVPDLFHDTIGPGSIVSVPAGRGNRAVEGLCVRLSERPWDHTRPPILACAPALGWLSASLAELGLWVSKHYACPPWKTFTALLPAALRVQRQRPVVYYRITGQAPNRVTPSRSAVIDALGDGELRRDALLTKASVTAAVVNGLVRQGVLERVERHETPAAVGGFSTAPALADASEDRFCLTEGQQAACDAIATAVRGRKFHAHVLFGVPGSGKTEVYVRTIRRAVEQGGQAILLIPEIALTTQLVERLRRRFPSAAVLHSQLTARVRRTTLQAIASGNVGVVLGTRTAVFAPCPELRLIIVDEEQETSFKNLAAPYYHARDVAIKRAQLEGTPVVLGSATPALETWHNAQTRSHYTLLRLPERVGDAKLPNVALIPHRAEPDDGGHIISRQLRDELQRTLTAGEQTILLHNRRGYATFLRCTRCGLLVDCTRCGGHLVYHQSERRLKCHRCGTTTAVPAQCLDETCGGRLTRAGLAIQRLEEELRRIAPEARLLRLDRDTMRKRSDYESALARFESRGADIMLGTQMVAKGLDFPHVRLVGVIDADAALALPDFRAGERVFQLIVQVVGRAGRRAGRSVAIVQTAHTPAILHDALRLDYERFASRELAARKHLFYPPYCRLLRLVCADERPERARAAADESCQKLRTCAARVHVGIRVDPAEPCVIRRLRGMLRYQVLTRVPHSVVVSEFIAAARDDRALSPNVQRVTIDVDAIDLM